MKRLTMGGLLMILALLAQPLLSARSGQIPQKHKPDTAQNIPQKSLESSDGLSITIRIKANSDPRFLLLDSKNVQLDVPYVHQYDDLPADKKGEIMKSACGPTVLTMSFKYFGLETDLMQVIDKLPTSVYVRGAMFYDLPAGSSIYDFTSTTIEANPKAFYETLKKGYPIILNVQNYNGIIGHALVITGIRDFDGENARALIIHDPYVGPNREFTFETSRTLRQPEGYINYIGTLKPFYITPTK